MEIRELDRGGADQLVTLFAAVLPESPTAWADKLDEPLAFLLDPSSFVLGAYIDGAPVGLAWITSNPEICHGQPTVRGLRYSVEHLLELLAAGMSIDEVNRLRSVNWLRGDVEAPLG